MGQKSNVNDVRDEILAISDYSITDSNLTTLVLKSITRNLKTIKQLLLDNFLSDDITQHASFKTVENQEYVDPMNARIVGNAATFTGVAGDKINVTIDGTTYSAIDIAASTTIALVVSAINTAVGTTVASASDDGYLVITSPTTASTSNVTIANNSGTPASRLFTVAAERTQASISDLDEILILSERTNDTDIQIIPYNDLIALYPDPTANYSNVPDYAARHLNRLYFGPTPNANILLYLDYYIDVSAVTSGGTMPFRNKYDPLVVAMVKKDLVEYLDNQNATGITVAKQAVDELKHDLIIAAVKNIGMNRGTQSRRPTLPKFAPRRVV